MERFCVRGTSAKLGLRGGSTVASVAAGFALVATAASVRADDPFEIQVFHVRVNEPSQLGLELHSNYVASGAARAPPARTANHVLYEMVEPTFGIAKGWEIGAHFQEAVRPSGPDWGGARLRTMAIVPTPDSMPVHFALDIEGGYTPPAYDPNTWDLELRPIVELRVGDFDFDVNPILDVTFTGPSTGAPRLEPAGAARYTATGTVDLGLEYYASLGPLGRFDPISRQGQYLFETIDLVRWPQWRVRAGLGEGLTPGSNPLTITTVLGHFF